VPFGATPKYLNEGTREGAAKGISLEAAAIFIDSTGNGVERKLLIPLGGHAEMDDYFVRHQQFMAFANAFLNDPAAFNTFGRVMFTAFEHVAVGFERVGGGKEISMITIEVGGTIGAATFTGKSFEIINDLQEAVNNAYRGRW
jgi:hypothetical protein